MLDVNPDINILIGDNQSGKSTILQAIYLDYRLFILLLAVVEHELRI